MMHALPAAIAQTVIDLKNKAHTRMTRSFPLAAKMSLEVGRIHLIGIGGIGMSGIAEILHNQGYQVQGSDVSENYNVERLRSLGIRVFIGHQEENVADAAVVVKSSAVKPENPEILAARKLRIPVLRRAEMLAEIMRLKICVAVAGTHGKTTTTSLTAAMFEAAGLEPTVINGGIINAYGTNAKVGKGDWMVVEADESDGTFTRLPLTVGIITNIDPEHLDYYGEFDTLKRAFYQYLDNLPFYGFGVLCLDHPEVQKLAAEVRDRRIVTYGLNPQADIQASNIRNVEVGQYFDVTIRKPNQDESITIADIYLPMHGLHNLRNSLAALAVAEELGLNAETIKKALNGFSGVKRRFTLTGTAKGVRIIDDYGHHPVEIMATLSAARQAVSSTGGKVIAVFQPHRYSRVASLFQDFCTCFNDADRVLVADVYSAGEAPLENISRESLIEGIRAAGHRHVSAMADPKQLAQQIHEIASDGDYVICLGAGNITYWAQTLPLELEKMSG
jgi:UDP-N-acetylmuramate--alanine ligase